MTAQDRRRLTDAAIDYLLALGEVPEYDLDDWGGYRSIHLHQDALRGVWLYLMKWDKYIAMFDHERKLLLVRKGTVYKPHFEAYATTNHWKLRELPELHFPPGPRGTHYTHRLVGDDELLRDRQNGPIRALHRITFRDPEDNVRDEASPPEDLAEDLEVPSLDDLPF